MKSWILPVLFMCLTAIPGKGFAQCGTIRTSVNTTTVTGSGSADPGYVFTVPKFDGGLGTLLSIRLASVVTVSFQYTIENMDPAAKTTRVRINRYDELSGPTITSDTNEYYGPPDTWTLLGGSDGVTGSGPDFRSKPPFYVLNNDTIFNNVYYNTADYIGSGGVNFYYKTDVGSQTNGNPNVNISGSATDIVQFISTYTYCDNIMLASEITTFAASRKNDIIEIRWLTGNETPNRTYELQKSYDGKNFIPITTVASKTGVNQVSSYEYNYSPLSGEKGKITFRIKTLENSYASKYTPLRVVDLGITENKSAMRLVPNPSNGAFAIMMSNTEVSDWTIEVFNIKGMVISKKQTRNTLLAKFQMNENLTPGIYFVLVTNNKSRQKQVERLLID